MELYCREVNIFDKRLIDDFFFDCHSIGMDVVPGDCSLILGKTYFSYKDFYHWYKEVNDLSMEVKLKKNQVGCSCFLVFNKEDDEFIGIFDIRHSLNYLDGDVLGHIGVTIKPSMRNKGLYKDVLRLCIKECGYFAIEKIVISCEYDNIVSKCGLDSVFGEGKLVPRDDTYLYVYEKED